MIFFDIDGTLINHKSAERSVAIKFQQEYVELFPETSKSFVQKWHKTAEEHLESYLLGKLSFQGQRRARIQSLFASHYLLNNKEADRIFATYLKHYEDSWKLYDDVINCLNSLKQYKLGIISNGDSAQQRKKLKALKISKYFSAIIISSEIGACKPSSEIFTKASELAGCPIDGCVYVGDRLQTDAQASTKAGMLGIWINRQTQSANISIPTIFSLSDLNKTVETLRHDNLKVKE